MTKHVVVIDDDKDILEALTVVLEDMGYEVTGFSQVVLALKNLPKHIPDLILLDFLLSGDDGREVAAKIKQIPGYKKVPIILMSAHNQLSEKSISTAVTTYLKKPFELNELESILRRYSST